MIGLIRKWLRQRAARSVEVSEAQWIEAEAKLPFLGHLSPDERLRLRELARAFIAEKEWSGAQGMALDPGMQLSIALQACLPILHLGLDWYRGWVGIVVYPGDFVIPRRIMDDAGVMHEYDDEVLGEAWEGGPVLLSWFGEDAQPRGINVVIHEFAHKLDMTNGEIDGLPALPEGMTRREWIAAFEPAYEDFCRRVESAEMRGEETALDPYGAEHPSEFFAVMSEAFFETPTLLSVEYPAVFEQLRRFYRQAPGTA